MGVALWGGISESTLVLLGQLLLMVCLFSATLFEYCLFFSAPFPLGSKRGKRDVDESSGCLCYSGDWEKTRNLFANRTKTDSRRKIERSMFYPKTLV